MDEKSLSHTSWNCKYHIVLVPKYRRKVIYGKLRKDIGKILRTLCDYKHALIVHFAQGAGNNGINRSILKCLCYLLSRIEI